MIRFWPHLTLAMAGFLIGMGLQHMIEKSRYVSLQNRFTQFQLDIAHVIKKESEKARAWEHEQLQKVRAVEEEKHARDEKIGVLERDVLARTRDVRLCRAASRGSVSDVPKASSAAGGDATGAERELPESPVPDLVALAADADRVTSRLEMCQDVIRSMQSGIP